MGTVENTTEALVRKALDEGVVHFATAQYYQKGKVEEFVGNIIKDYKREDIVLGTGVTPQPLDYKEGLFKKNTDIATMGVMLGFAVMMTLDVALG